MGAVTPRMDTRIHGPRPLTPIPTPADLRETRAKLIEVDGKLGPKSRAGIAAWQTARALPATGDIDAATLDVMRLA